MNFVNEIDFKVDHQHVEIICIKHNQNVFSVKLTFQH